MALLVPLLLRGNVLLAAPRHLPSSLLLRPITGTRLFNRIPCLAWGSGGLREYDKIPFT